jgi:hypothetical protein
MSNHTIRYQAPSLAEFTATMQRLLRAREGAASPINLTIGPCIGLVGVSITNLVGVVETLNILIEVSEQPHCPRVK